MNIDEARTGVRVLFSGDYWPGANSLYIMRAFEKCGAVVRLLNDSALVPEWITVRGRILRRLVHRLILEAEWNRQLLASVETFAPDLIYITNAHLCRPQTLDRIRKKSIPVMCFYHDVAWKGLDGSNFAECTPFFDLVATTRRWQDKEFRSAGAKDVAVVRFGYDPLVHRPLQVAPPVMECYGADVVFVGTHEVHRAVELQSLVEDGFPYRFRLWGNLWDRLPPGTPVRQYWQGRAVYEQEIPVIYASSKVALQWVCWEPHGTRPELRQGDRHNSRTFQITACGGAMMLAQRTDEQVRFFSEDVEAVYFDGPNDLHAKLAFWLDPRRDKDRAQIAAAARLRCTTEDYSYVPVVRRFLDYFGFPGT